MTFSAKTIEACNLFRTWHDSLNHRRKYTGLPYFDNHCMEVVNLVAKVTNNEDILIGAAGHDAIEDCFPLNSEYSLEEITKRFGGRAASMVSDLTDIYTKESFPSLNRAARKKKEAERLGSTSPESQTIKVADLISNSSDIVKNGPSFAKTYLREKEFLLTFLTKGDRDLWNKAWVQLQENLEKLSMKPRITLSQIVH